MEALELPPLALLRNGLLPLAPATLKVPRDAWSEPHTLQTIATILGKSWCVCQPNRFEFEFDFELSEACRHSFSSKSELSPKPLTRLRCLPRRSSCYLSTEYKRRYRYKNRNKFITFKCTTISPCSYAPRYLPTARGHHLDALRWSTRQPTPTLQCASTWCKRRPMSMLGAGQATLPLFMQPCMGILTL